MTSRTRAGVAALVSSALLFTGTVTVSPIAVAEEASTQDKEPKKSDGSSTPEGVNYDVKDMKRESSGRGGVNSSLLKYQFDNSAPWIKAIVIIAAILGGLDLLGMALGPLRAGIFTLTHR